MPPQALQCACSPTCPVMPGKGWVYAYGHKPKGVALTQASRTKRKHTREVGGKPVYIAALASLRTELGVMDREIDRLDDQADTARKTAAAAQAAKDKAVERHELLAAIIGGLEELTGAGGPTE